MCEINTHLTQISNALNIEKKLGDELRFLRNEFVALFLWTCSIDMMNWAQLEIFKKALEELKNLVAQNANNLVIKDTHNQTLPFCVDNVSPSNIPLQNQLIPQQVPPQNKDITEFIEARRKVNMCEINTQLTQNSNTLDIEKKLGD
ncbi:hypothetical protein RYX36_014042 [Vicia faba]